MTGGGPDQLSRPQKVTAVPAKPLHGLARHMAADDLGSPCTGPSMPPTATEGSQVSTQVCCEGKASTCNPFCVAHCKQNIEHGQLFFPLAV